MLTNGHRFDTVANANGLISSGMSCEIVFYRWTSTQILRRHGAVRRYYHPHQPRRTRAVSTSSTIAQKPVWPTPETMSSWVPKFRARSRPWTSACQTSGATTRQRTLTPASETIAFQPQVVNQNRDTAGESIWIIS